nr:uncharacterized protein K02A2.6-like [Lepeophtheirus salmonis]
MWIQHYQFKLSWKKGKDQIIADTLSRAPVDDPGREEEELDKIRRIAKADEDFCALVQFAECGLKEKGRVENHYVRLFMYMIKDLAVEDELKGTQIVVPRACQKDILSKLHLSNQEMTTTKKRAKESIFWPEMNNEIDMIIENCETCRRKAPSQCQENLKLVDIPQLIFESMPTDLFMLNRKSYLICVDALSGYTAIEEYKKDPNMDKIITTFSNWFTNIGYLKNLRSDQGTPFLSLIFSYNQNPLGSSSKRDERVASCRSGIPNWKLGLG